eukprot:m.685179 g.685179  ORF g.685179 m.685179 type:complete len:73 (+) comp22835_c0_seq12:2568-2786(+)
MWLVVANTGKILTYFLCWQGFKYNAADGSLRSTFCVGFAADQCLALPIDSGSAHTAQCTDAASFGWELVFAP